MTKKEFEAHMLLLGWKRRITPMMFNTSHDIEWRLHKNCSIKLGGDQPRDIGFIGLGGQRPIYCATYDELFRQAEIYNDTPEGVGPGEGGSYDTTKQRVSFYRAIQSTDLF